MYCNGELLITEKLVKQRSEIYIKPLKIESTENYYLIVWIDKRWPYAGRCEYNAHINHELMGFYLLMSLMEREKKLNKPPNICKLMKLSNLSDDLNCIET